MELPMAAKKTRKPSKKLRTKATPSGKRTSSKRPSTQRTSSKRTSARPAKKRAVAKTRVKRTVARAKSRPVLKRQPRKLAAKPKRPPARKPKPVKKRVVARKPKAVARSLGPPTSNRTSKRERAAPEPTPSRSRAILEKRPDKRLEKKGPAPTPAATKSRSPGGPKPPVAKNPGKEKPSLRGQGRAPLREAPPRLVALPLPILVAPKRPSVEERASLVEARLMAQTDEFRKSYEERLDMSWIYHDSALEGVVYTFEELRTALSGQAPPVTDSSLQPTYDDIRRHKEAIEFVRDYGMRKKLPVTVDIIKKIYLILHPEEGDIKTVKYRKDIPQHRLYFHEYAPPDKIAYKVRQIVDWLNDPETRKTRNGVRIAARAHYDLLRVYPFPTDSGKVSRLFMNLMLMRTGLPPAIVHSTERQRYYEALKGSATTVLQMVQEAVENALSSVEKLLDEHETRKRAFVS